MSPVLPSGSLFRPSCAYFVGLLCPLGHLLSTLRRPMYVFYYAYLYTLLGGIHGLSVTAQTINHITDHGLSMTQREDRKVLTKYRSPEHYHGIRRYGTVTIIHWGEIWVGKALTRSRKCKASNRWAATHQY